MARRLGGKELYDCRECGKNPALLEQLGHDGPPTNYWRENLITDEPLKRCPLRDLLQAHDHNPELAAEVDRYVGIYMPAYRDGHLLVGGGIADQPVRYLEIIREIAQLDAAAEVKYHELTKPET